jgi:hypothetical protein
VGSNLKAHRLEQFGPNGELPEGTEAIVIHRSSSATKNYQHWGEADALGILSMIPWDMIPFKEKRLIE